MDRIPAKTRPTSFIADGKQGLPKGTEGRCAFPSDRDPHLCRSQTANRSFPRTRVKSPTMASQNPMEIQAKRIANTMTMAISSLFPPPWGRTSAMRRLAKKLEERMSAPMRSLLNLAAFSHGFLDFFIRICNAAAACRASFTRGVITSGPLT